MKSIINKIKVFLMNAWGNLFGFLVSKADVAIKLTDIVKSVIDNPATGYAVAWTPTRLDDKLLADAKLILPKITVQLGIAMNLVNAIDAEKDPEKMAGLVFAFVSEKLPNDGKAIFYRELSGKIALALSDGKFSTGEIIALVQLVYNKLIK
jgi:hypothetical protein